MAPFIHLSAQQQRLLTTCNENATCPDISLRDLSTSHEVPITSLRRAVKRPETTQAILEASTGRGQKKRLFDEEEKLITHAAIEFHHSNGALLDRECMLDPAQRYIKSLVNDSEKSASPITAQAYAG